MIWNNNFSPGSVLNEREIDRSLEHLVEEFKTFFVDTKSDIVWDLDWHVLPQFGRVMMIGRRLWDVWEKKTLQPSAIVKVRSSLLINLHCWWPECNLSLTFSQVSTTFLSTSTRTCGAVKTRNVSRGFLEFQKFFIHQRSIISWTFSRAFAIFN